MEVCALLSAIFILQRSAFCLGKNRLTKTIKFQDLFILWLLGLFNLSAGYTNIRFTETNWQRVEDGMRGWKGGKVAAERRGKPHVRSAVYGGRCPGDPTCIACHVTLCPAHLPGRNQWQFLW